MEKSEIKSVLKAFQDGYTKRNVKIASEFMDNLFVTDDKSYILGTSTSELDFGYDEMKQLFSDDWEYWGDVRLDYDNAKINVYGNTAFVSMFGYVEIDFDYDDENKDSLETVIDKVKESGISSKQKVAFINWILTIDHLRNGERKSVIKYPLRLSGVLLNKNGWKFSQLHFSIPRSEFADERFEHDKEFVDNYNTQIAKVENYDAGTMDNNVKELLLGLQDKLIGNSEINENVIDQYFTGNDKYIISPDNNLYDGSKQIADGFKKSSKVKLSLDFKHAITRNSDDAAWVTICGTLKVNEDEEELFNNILNDINHVSEIDSTVEEKLFKINRKAAYAILEVSSGSERTCPVRITANIVNVEIGPRFDSLHISYPYYWIFNGRFDKC